MSARSVMPSRIFTATSYSTVNSYDLDVCASSGCANNAVVSAIFAKGWKRNGVLLHVNVPSRGLSELLVRCGQRFDHQRVGTTAIVKFSCCFHAIAGKFQQFCILSLGGS